jgi:hypothetical protein
MSPPRFVHKRIFFKDLTDELSQQVLSIQEFGAIFGLPDWIVGAWNGKDIPTWVPIALTLLLVSDAKQAALAATKHPYTGADFGAGLRQSNLTIPEFSRIWCQRVSDVERWVTGETRIPPWAQRAVAMMSQPKSIGTALLASAAMIKLDNEHPEHGEYPFFRASTSNTVRCSDRQSASPPS